MRKRLTQKQETFCLKYFELGNATEAAIQAGYKPKTAVVIASENLTKPNIQVRLQELRQKAEDDSIMGVVERKQRLTQFARARPYNPKVTNPVQAIDLLNKMDKLYSEGATVNIDNRKIEIIVKSEESRNLLAEIAEGITPHADGND